MTPKHPLANNRTNPTCPSSVVKTLLYRSWRSKLNLLDGSPTSPRNGKATEDLRDEEFPWRRSSFQKKAEPDLSSQDPPILSTTPWWSGATFVRKTFQSNLRAHTKTSGITIPSDLYAAINVGVMSICEARILSQVKCNMGFEEPTGRSWLR